MTQPRWNRIAPALVFLVAIAAFLPCLRNGFVSWDDRVNFLANPSYRGLGWSNIRWMFAGTPLKAVYQPLSWLTLGLDYLVWGLDPRGYHLTSMLWHGASAALFYFVCVLLFRAALPAAKARPGPTAACAAFAALLFAVHPLRVESVAWASERRDVVSGFFYLASLLAYLRAWPDPSRRGRWLVAALVAHSASLLSKPIGVGLPFTLLVLDVYPLRRLPGDPRRWRTSEGRRVLLEKAAFAALAAAVGVVTLSVSGSAGELADLASRGVATRMAQAAFGLAFYVRKTFLPFGLSPLYVFPPRLDPLEARFVLSGLAAAAAAAGLVWLALRRRPALPAAGLHYAAALAPVLGLVVIGPQLAADRYSYLACLGIPAVLAGALLASWSDERRRTIVLAMALVVSALAALTWRQSLVWRDSESLWRRALAVDPDNHVAHHNLAVVLHEKSDRRGAIEHDREALRLAPDYVNAHVVLCALLSEDGEMAEALQHCTVAVHLNPRSPDAHMNLGVIRLQLRQLDLAEASFREALRLRPGDAGAAGNLALVLMFRGR